MADIFLSYSRNDKTLIERLAKRLTAEGWTVFWDLHIQTGTKWDDVLQRELDAARAVVVAWSATSIQSSWVKEEAAHGRERNILVPIIIDDIQAPLGFSLIQAENLSSWSGTDDSPELTRLLSALHTLLDTKAASQQDTTARDETPSPRPIRTATREKILLSSDELIDRLTRSIHWDASQLDDARQFFATLSDMRRELGIQTVEETKALYHPFDPDALITAKSNADDDQFMDAASRTKIAIDDLLQNAGYQKISEELVEAQISNSYADLQIHVDFTDFDQLGIYYKGTAVRHETLRPARRLYLKTAIEIPTFSRLIILFKPAKPLAGGHDTSNNFLYLKMFKDVARADIEMIFPNAQIRTSLLSKINLSIIGFAAIGFTLVATAGKIALLASNPIGAIGSLFAVIAAFARALMRSGQLARQYMIQMMKLHYWHAMAANADVLTSVQERAAEEIITEDVLLYFLLLKQPTPMADLQKLVQASERYLLLEYGITMPLDFENSVQRLLEYGVISVQNGTLQALSPSAASTAIAVWSRDNSSTTANAQA